MKCLQFKHLFCCSCDINRNESGSLGCPRQPKLWDAAWKGHVGAGKQMDVCMAGRLLLPANTSWSQTGSAGDFVVQFEPLKGLAVFSGRAVGVCTPLNSLWLCAPITSLGALITTKDQGEG